MVCIYKINCVNARSSSWKYIAAASETRVNLNVKKEKSAVCAVINLLALVFMQITQATLFMHLTMSHARAL